jgi:hypothetical protein
MKKIKVDKTTQIATQITDIEIKFFEEFRPKSTDIGDRVRRNYNTLFDRLSKVVHSKEIVSRITQRILRRWYSNTKLKNGMS